MNFKRNALSNVHSDFIGLILTVNIRQLSEAKTIQSGRIDESINGDFLILALDAERLANLFIILALKGFFHEFCRFENFTKFVLMG